MTEVPSPVPAVTSGLRALIVGAAGSSGQSFAGSLRRLGVDIIAADQDEVGLARLRQDLDCPTLPMDALDEEQVAGLFDRVAAELGEIDLLINVAGRGYVRALTMMRVSRAFNRRPRAHPAYVINVAAPADLDDCQVTYAGSEVAFDRLSQGLSETIANPLIRILTLHRLESPAAFTDICERLCGELRDPGPSAYSGTTNRAIH